MSVQSSARGPRPSAPIGFVARDVRNGVLLVRRTFPFESVRATVFAVEGETTVRVECVDLTSTLGGMLAFAVLPFLVFVGTLCSPERSHALLGLSLLTLYKAQIASGYRQFQQGVEWVRRRVGARGASRVEAPSYRVVPERLPVTQASQFERAGLAFRVVSTAAGQIVDVHLRRTTRALLLSALLIPWVAIGWASDGVRLPVALVAELAQWMWVIAAVRAWRAVHAVRDPHAFTGARERIHGRR